MGRRELPDRDCLSATPLGLEYASLSSHFVAAWRSGVQRAKEILLCSFGSRPRSRCLPPAETARRGVLLCLCLLLLDGLLCSSRLGGCCWRRRRCCLFLFRVVCERLHFALSLCGVCRMRSWRHNLFARATGVDSVNPALVQIGDENYICESQTDSRQLTRVRCWLVRE